MSTLPAATKALLLQLDTDMGTPTSYKYCTGQSNIVHTTLGTFTPALFELELKELTGRADNENEQAVLVTEAIQPLVDYGSFPSHAPVTASVWVVDLADVDNTEELLWKGELVELAVNVDKKRGVYRAVIAGPKRRYQNRPLGLICLSTCAWRFGDHMCEKDVAALEETRTVSTISGLTITLSSALTVSAFNRWNQGFVRKGALAIKIIENVGNLGTTLLLAREPPASWASTSVIVRPGCDKTLTGCRNWNNEARFGAFGFAMPNADPRIGSI